MILVCSARQVVKFSADVTWSFLYNPSFALTSDFAGVGRDIVYMLSSRLHPHAMNGLVVDVREEQKIGIEVERQRAESSSWHVVKTVDARWRQ